MTELEFSTSAIWKEATGQKIELFRDLFHDMPGDYLCLKAVPTFPLCLCEFGIAAPQNQGIMQGSRKARIAGFPGKKDMIIIFFCQRFEILNGNSGSVHRIRPAIPAPTISIFFSGSSF